MIGDQMKENIVKDFTTNFVKDCLDIDDALVGWLVSLSKMKRVMSVYCRQFKLKLPTIREFDKLMLNCGIIKKSKNIKTFSRKLVNPKTGKNTVMKSTMRCWEGCKLKHGDGKLEIKYFD